LSYYVTFIGGLIFVIPVGAVIARQVAFWVAGFKPRYLRALLSTLVALAAGYGIGLALGALGWAEHDPNATRGAQFLIGWGLLSDNFNIFQQQT
jgi:hypothetical protein